MQPVVRALNVLKHVSLAPAGLKLGELAAQLGLPVASAHRIVRVLEEERYVSRGPTSRRYVLGPAVREMLQSDMRSRSLFVTPHQALVDAQRCSGETVLLAEFRGDQVVCVASVESCHPLRLSVREGQELPLDATASARVLLASCADGFARDLLGSERSVSGVAGGSAELDETVGYLNAVREHGYDVCTTELGADAWAIAVPVQSASGRVVAAVSLAAPSGRVSDAATREEAARIVAKAAKEMGDELGWIS